MIVLDTTVLVYAVGDDHALREPARAIVEAVEDGSIQATTTVEAIQELVHVRARRRGRADAAAVGRAYATLLSPLLQPSEEASSRGCGCSSARKRSGPSMRCWRPRRSRQKAEALVSADRAFADVRGLRWVDLAADELASLIAR